MTKKTINLTMAAAIDNGNGFSKSYIQFEDGFKQISITPSIFAPVSGQGRIPSFDQSNITYLDKGMDALIKSPALQLTSEYLIGDSAINSGNALASYNVEANTGKTESDVTIIIPLAKIAYTALAHTMTKTQSIPTTININITHYVTCLPIREFSNLKKREFLRKKLSKGKHTVTIKSLEQDVKVIVSFNLDNISVYPEGILSQIGLIYSYDNYPDYRNDDIYKESPYANGQVYAQSGNTLLIDIGDGTTDISVMDATHPIKGAGVNTSLNLGAGTAAAAASDQLSIDYPQIGHYTRSVFIDHTLKDNKEGRTLHDKYLEPQINLLMNAIEAEAAKEFKKMNNDINTVVVLGGGANLLTAKNKADFQAMLDSINPLADHQQIWWISSKYNQLLNLDGLRVLLNRKMQNN